MTTTKVTRKDLYNLVWRTPMSRLAAEFGVSDVALAKTCVRLAVPRPGRGYWAKLAAGIRTKRPPLAKASGVEDWTFFERVESPTERPRKQEAPTVPMPKDLRDASDAVKRLGLALGAAGKDEYGRLLVPGAHGPLLAVSIASHRRALLLLAGLGVALERRGHSVALREEGEANALSIVLGDDTIAIALVERLEQKEHVLTPEELRRAAMGYRYGIPKYDHFAGGRLQLVVHDVRGNRTSWSDTKTRTLDKQLGAVILAAEASGFAGRPTMTVKIREYMKSSHTGYEADVRFKWPDGSLFRRRYRAPVNTKAQAQRWGEDLGLGIIQHVPRIRLLAVDACNVPAWYEVADYKRLVEAAAKVDPRVHLLVLLGGSAGLRRGEIIALKWTDLDIKRRIIHVQRSIWWSRDGERHETVPKGGKGRDVDMTVTLADALKAARNLRERVVTRDDGTELTNKIVRTWFARAQRLAGLEQTGAIHRLRHTFCSMLAAEGATPRAIQALAGHEHISTTMKYMHLSPTKRAAAIGLLDAAWTRPEIGETVEKGTAAGA